MKSIRLVFMTSVFTAAALVSSSCRKGEDGVQVPTGPGNQSNYRISITNDPSQLRARMTYRNEPIAIDSTGVGGLRQLGKRLAFSLQLVAEVSPPSIGGQTLQATSVDIRGNRALVSYNMRGDQYLGGIDVFNIQNRSNPVLTSQALFQNADINAVTVSGSNVFAVEATGDTGFIFPAVFEKMRLQGDNLVLDGNARLGLTSFAGTGVTSSGTLVYATSGNTGGLSIIDPVNMLITNAFGLHDARWVDVAEGKIVVVQGTPGQISVYAETTLVPQGTFSFTGANVPESKSTVEILGGKAFVAAGPGGVRVLSTVTGMEVGWVPRPNPDSLGLDSAVVVTNAVSADDDVLFISNGEAGVYVAQGSVNFGQSGSEDQQQITMLGRLRFSNLQSVNHVEYKSRYLIIASGLGGLKIVNVNF